MHYEVHRTGVPFAVEHVAGGMGAQPGQVPILIVHESLDHGASLPPAEVRF
jgi:hypothetical protein